jgi:hypothetical protein
MDSHECQPVYLEILEFYEGLNMKLEQQVPMLLVERQALNEAMEGEKNVCVDVFVTTFTCRILLLLFLLSFCYLNIKLLFCFSLLNVGSSPFT